MHIYTIGDLHLSLASDKPMDVFGERWLRHDQRIAEAWRRLVAPEDVVVIPGDLSWAQDLSGVLPDLRYLEALPGRKILLKGNHEHWWGTGRKLEQLREEQNLTGIRFLHNSYIYIEEKNICICGTRGWKCPTTGEPGVFTQQDAKIYNREVLRLAYSLKQAQEEHCEILAFLHFPPFNCAREENGFTELLEQYGVSRCFYGHLHGPAHKWAFQGKLSVSSCTEYRLVSADYLDFTPYRIL